MMSLSSSAVSASYPRLGTRDQPQGPVRGSRRSPRRILTCVDVLDEGGARCHPAKEFPGQDAGRRHLHAEEGADPPKVILDAISGDRSSRQMEGAADRLSDVAGRDTVFGDTVQADASWSLSSPMATRRPASDRCTAPQRLLPSPG